MTEAEIQHAIRLALGREPDFTMWRNDVGVGVRREEGRSQRATRYGLCRGSSDLVGILAPHGRWVALEVKSATGQPTEEQLMFLSLIRRRGGFGAVVRSVDEARGALDRARAGGVE